MNNIIKDISYGVIPVSKKDNDYLFCLVLHQAGHWAFPKGHLIDKETPLETAQRELYEETRINQCSIADNISFKEKYNFEQNGQNIEKTVIYFLGFVDEPKIPLPKSKLEISDVKWLTYDEAIKLLTYQEAKEMFRKAKSYIDKIYK